MTLDLVVIGKTAYLAVFKVNKQMMVYFDAVLVSWSGHSFSLIIPSADETGIDVYVR